MSEQQAGLETPFEVYDDYEGRKHIIDGTTRIVLSDVYAYDADDEAREARMEWIARALSSHSALLEALRGLLDAAECRAPNFLSDSTAEYMAARAALAAATGTPKESDGNR